MLLWAEGVVMKAFLLVLMSISIFELVRLLKFRRLLYLIIRYLPDWGISLKVFI